MMVPSESDDAVPLKLTFSGVVPDVGVAVKLDVGEMLTTASLKSTLISFFDGSVTSVASLLTNAASENITVRLEMSFASSWFVAFPFKLRVICVLESLLKCTVILIYS